MQGQRVEDVRIERLRFGLSPRTELCDHRHVAALAEVLDQVPPIVVHRPTMRVIDGVHRVHAARSLGRETIRALLFDGDEVAAHIEAVRSNVTHGKPLTLAEREAAAVHIVQLVPDWSDRRIAGVSGLSPKTVARLRTRATVDSAQSRARVGRDGRLRPLDPTEVRRRVAEAVRSDPEASTRAIAARTGASQATVRDVRQRLSRGLSELITRPRRSRRKAGPGPEAPGTDDADRRDDEPGAADDADDADEPGRPGDHDDLDDVGEPVAPTNGTGNGLAAGPGSLAAVDFATWFEQHRIDEADWQRFVNGLPISRVYEVADACRRFSAAWRAFAIALEDRARTHRRSSSSPSSGSSSESTA
jgi:ParB-like chromosome segregation protein Spo0J